MVSPSDMAYFDVFNGDADGMCALHQLRMANPRDATLITGTKRDIALLGRVNAHADDTVTVLDVSFDVNRAAALALLQQDVTIEYFDHHGSGEVPAHPGLRATINTAPQTCTGMLVDQYLGGRFRVWAVVAAFGDNLARPAHALATALGMPPAHIHALQVLGECLNYNAYGDEEADLAIHPANLYQLLHRHADPFSFIDHESIYASLRQTRAQDLELARKILPYFSHVAGHIILLPDAAWARRVRGTYGNELAVKEQQLAHALFTPNAAGGYTVSVRAPVKSMRGADRLCRQFATGGGRPAAAGINQLPQEKLQEFTEAFTLAFS